MSRQTVAGETTECDLLRENNQLLASILETFGVSDTNGNEPIPSIYEYASIPPEKELETLALPPGIIQFDFEKGEIIHSAAVDSSFPDAGILKTNLRKFEDMLKGIDMTGQSLRSVQIWSDVDGSLGFDRIEGGYIHLFAGLVESVKSHGFKSFVVEADYPFELQANVSTRVDAFETSDKRGSMTRRGEFPSATQDTYASMYWWPGGMDALLSDAGTSLDHTDYQVEELRTLGHDNVTIQVANDGANDIDAKVQARDEPLEDWYDIGVEALSIGSGDHTIFDVQEEHRELRTQVRNSTNTQAISATGQMTAGGT